MASPSPKQIEKALAAQDFEAARGMVNSVLVEHPNSARAHLMNAYILEHADHNAVAANEELKNVVRLDNKGDVKYSSLFGKVVAEIEATPVVVQKHVEPRKTSYAQPSYQSASQSGSHAIVYILLGCGVLIIAGILYSVINQPKVIVQKIEQERFYPAYTTHSSGETYRETVDREQPIRSSAYIQPVPQQTFIAAQPQVINQAPQRQGMGMLGTAASVAGGVVAGELLMDAIHGNSGHHHGGYRDNSDRDYDAPWRETTRYEAPKVDYLVKESSFSSGSDDSWTTSSSSSSSSSDSSWDDSSSSSGSDSGGSDW